MINLAGGFGITECDEARRLFTEEHLAEAERALGLETPHNELRNELAHLLWKSVRNRRDGAPRPKETLGYLDCIARSAADLSSALANLLAGEGSASTDRAAFLLWTVGDAELDGSEVGRLHEGVARLAAAAKKAAAAIRPESSKGGAPINIERHVVLSYLDEIVFRCCGNHLKYSYDAYKEEYKGPLFWLLRAFADAEADALGEDLKSDAALAKFIREASPDDKT